MGYTGTYTNPQFPVDYIVGDYQSHAAIPVSLGGGQSVVLQAGTLPPGLVLDGALNTLSGIATTVADVDVTFRLIPDNVDYPYTIIILDIQLKIDGVAGNPTTDLIFTNLNHSFTAVYSGSYTPDSHNWTNLSSYFPSNLVFTGGAITTATLIGRLYEAGQFYLNLSMTDSIHTKTKLFYIQSNLNTPATQDNPVINSTTHLGTTLDTAFTHNFKATLGVTLTNYIFSHTRLNDWSLLNPAPAANSLSWSEFSSLLDPDTGDLSLTPSIVAHPTQRFIVKDTLIQSTGKSLVDETVSILELESIPFSTSSANFNVWYSTTPTIYPVPSYPSNPYNLYKYNHLTGTNTLAKTYSDKIHAIILDKDVDTTGVITVITSVNASSNWTIRKINKTSFAETTNLLLGGTATAINCYANITNKGATTTRKIIFFNGTTASGQTVIYDSSGTFITAPFPTGAGQNYVACVVTDLKTSLTDTEHIPILWVLDKGSKEIVKYDITTNTILTTISLPVGTTLNGQFCNDDIKYFYNEDFGNVKYLIITDSGQNKLYRYNLNTSSFDAAIVIGGFNKPSNLYIDNKDTPNIYCLNQATNEIYILNEDFSLNSIKKVNSAIYSDTLIDSGQKILKSIVKPTTAIITFTNTDGTTTTDTDNGSGLFTYGTINYTTGVINYTFPGTFVSGTGKIKYQSEPNILKGWIDPATNKIVLATNFHLNVFNDRVSTIDSIIDVGRPTFNITSTRVKELNIGDFYSLAFSVSPISAYTPSLVSGSLPTGLSMSGGGGTSFTISGTVASSVGKYYATYKFTPTPTTSEDEVWVVGENIVYDPDYYEVQNQYIRSYINRCDPYYNGIISRWDGSYTGSSNWVFTTEYKAETYNDYFYWDIFKIGRTLTTQTLLTAWTPYQVRGNTDLDTTSGAVPTIFTITPLTATATYKNISAFNLLSEVLTTLTPATEFSAAVFDGTYLFVSDGYLIKKLDITSPYSTLATSSAIDTTGGYPSALATDGTYLYAINTNKIYKIDKTTLIVSSSTSITYTGIGKLFYVNSKLYLLTYNYTQIYSINTTTLAATLLATVNGDIKSYYIYGKQIYIGTNAPVTLVRFSTVSNKIEKIASLGGAPLTPHPGVGTPSQTPTRAISYMPGLTPGYMTFEFDIFDTLNITPDGGPFGPFCSNFAISKTFTVTGGVAPYVVTERLSSVLPIGITFNGGLLTLSGTTSQFGSFNLAVTITDNNGNTKDVDLPFTVNESPIIADSSPLVSTLEGAPYSHIFTLSNANIVTWSVVSGSTGALVLNSSTGELSGIPLVIETLSFTIRATDTTTGCYNQKAFILDVLTSAQVAITTPDLPNICYNVPYSQFVEVVGGTPPYTWSVLSGSMPPEFTLDTGTGEIYGTSITPGTYDFDIEVVDSALTTDSKPYTIVVYSEVIPDISNIVDGFFEVPYSQLFLATGGTTPYTFALNLIPDGLTLQSDTGLLEGTPTTEQTVNYTLTVTDINGCIGTINGTIIIQPTDPPVINTNDVPSVCSGNNYNFQLDVTGGILPYTFSIISGGLPPGITLDTVSGLLYGTPPTSAASQSYGFEVQVIDSYPHTVSKAFTLNVHGTPRITDSSLVGAIIGIPYGYTFSAVGSLPPFVWLLNGTLPSGLSFNSNLGSINGTPLESGNFPITISVIGESCPSSKQFILPVAGYPIISVKPLRNGCLNQDYSEFVLVTGGLAPYYWFLDTGLLPNGLEINPYTGEIAGKAIKAGKFTFSIRVQDSNGLNSYRDCVIIIKEDGECSTQGEIMVEKERLPSLLSSVVIVEDNFYQEHLFEYYPTILAEGSKTNE